MGFFKRLKPPRSITAAVNRLTDPIRDAAAANPVLAAAVAGVSAPVLAAAAAAGLSPALVASAAADVAALDNPEVATKVVDAAPLALSAAGLIAGPAGAAVGSAVGSAVKTGYDIATAPKLPAADLPAGAPTPPAGPPPPQPAELAMLGGLALLLLL